MFTNVSKKQWWISEIRTQYLSQQPLMMETESLWNVRHLLYTDTVELITQRLHCRLYNYIFTSFRINFKFAFLMNFALCYQQSSVGDLQFSPCLVRMWNLCHWLYFPLLSRASQCRGCSKRNFLPYIFQYFLNTSEVCLDFSV